MVLIFLGMRLILLVLILARTVLFGAPAVTTTPGAVDRRFGATARPAAAAATWGSASCSPQVSKKIGKAGDFGMHLSGVSSGAG